MLEKLRDRLQRAKLAVQAAEEHIYEVQERSPERLAQRDLEAQQTELAHAELAVKRGELQALQQELAEASRQRTALHAKIRRQPQSLLPDLAELAEVERTGDAFSVKAFALEMELKAPLASVWRDPAVPGASDLITRWIGKLEG
jgi:hypothetical protein